MHWDGSVSLGNVLMFAGLIATLYSMQNLEARRRQAQHLENREDIKEIKTMLKPLWEWWNRGGGGSDAGETYQRRDR